MSPTQRMVLHRVLKYAWAAALIPTLIWWKDSILWVAAMSLYANVVGHASAQEAAKAAVEAERREHER